MNPIKFGVILVHIFGIISEIDELFICHKILLVQHLLKGRSYLTKTFGVCSLCKRDKPYRIQDIVMSPI